MAATGLEELNQTMESNDKKGRPTTYIIKVRRAIRDQMRKESNEFILHYKYRCTAY